MSSLGMRLVGRLSLTHSKPDAYRRHADQEDDGREQASDSALPVSRETGPAPRKRRPYRSRQSGGARCHDRTCRASLTDGTRSAPPKADASATFFRLALRRIPPSTTYSAGVRCRALGGGIRLLLTCEGIRPTRLRGGRGHHVSSAAWNHGFCAR